MLQKSEEIFQRSSTWYGKYGRRKQRYYSGRYKAAEDRVFQFFQDGLASESYMPATIIQATMRSFMEEMYGISFSASNTWLHGKCSKHGKGKRTFTLGWKHRYGVSFRQVTKSSPVSMKDKLEKLRRHHWWLVNKMLFLLLVRRGARSILNTACTKVVEDLLPIKFRWLLTNLSPNCSKKRFENGIWLEDNEGNGKAHGNKFYFCCCSWTTTH